jgi:hypothetical protein
MEGEKDASSHIAVRIPSTRVVSDQPGKNFTEYTIVFSVGEVEHRITKRYSFYRAVHEKVRVFRLYSPVFAYVCVYV